MVETKGYLVFGVGLMLKHVCVLVLCH